MQVIDDSFEILNDQNFVFYQGFFMQEAAEDFKNLLTEANIQSVVEETKYFGERVIFGNVNQFPYVLKVLKSDLSSIPTAIQSSLEKQPLSYFENHPLNSLDNSELQKLLENTSGESYETQFTAIKILNLRGLTVDNKTIQILIENPNKVGTKSNKISKTKLALTFLMMLSGVIISWIIILISVLIFLEYAFGKSYDVSGKKALTYDKTTRSISKTFLLIGLVINIFSISYLYSYQSHLFLRFFNTPFLSVI